MGEGLDPLKESAPTDDSLEALAQDLVDELEASNQDTLFAISGDPGALLDDTEGDGPVDIGDELGPMEPESTILPDDLFDPLDADSRKGSKRYAASDSALSSAPLKRVAADSNLSALIAKFRNRHGKRVYAYMQRHPQSDEHRRAKQQHDYTILLMLVLGGDSPAAMAAWSWIAGEVGRTAARVVGDWSDSPAAQGFSRDDVVQIVLRALVRQCKNRQNEIESARVEGATTRDHLGEKGFAPHCGTWEAYLYTTTDRTHTKLLTLKQSALSTEPPSDADDEGVEFGTPTKVFATALEQGFLCNLEIEAYLAAVGYAIPLADGDEASYGLDRFSQVLHAARDSGSATEAERAEIATKLRKQANKDFNGISARLFACQFKSECSDDRIFFARIQQAHRDGWMSPRHMAELCSSKWQQLELPEAGYLFEAPALRMARLGSPQKFQVGGIEGSVLDALINFHAGWLFDAPDILRVCDYLVERADLAAFCGKTELTSFRDADHATWESAVRDLAAALPSSGDAVLTTLGVKPVRANESVSVRKVWQHGKLRCDLLDLGNRVREMEHQVIDNAPLYEGAAAAIKAAVTPDELLVLLRDASTRSRYGLSQTTKRQWLHTDGHKAAVGRLWRAVHEGLPPTGGKRANESWTLYAVCREDPAMSDRRHFASGVREILRLLADGREPAEPPAAVRFACLFCGEVFASRESFLSHRTACEGCRS